MTVDIVVGEAVSPFDSSSFILIHPFIHSIPFSHSVHLFPILFHWGTSSPFIALITDI